MIENSRILWPMRAAMPWVVRIHEKRLADPMMMSTMPLKMADSVNIFKNWAGLIFR